MLNMVIRNILNLLIKEFKSDFRSKFALGNLFLYIAATLFICYLAFLRVRPEVWNAMFWVIMLFIAVNAVAKTFQQDGNKRNLYLFTLLDPIQLFIAKCIYNALLLFISSLLTYGFATLFLGQIVLKPLLFVVILLAASSSLAFALTFVSSLSAQAKSNASLLAVLGFPILIPILIIVIRLSANCMGLFEDLSMRNDFLLLGAVDLILLGLGFLLFPYVWKD